MKNCIYCFLLILAACGGGSDKGGTTLPPPVVESESPGGFWVGIDTDGQGVILFVTEAGRFQFITEGGDQGPGTLSVSNGNTLSGSFQLLPLPGLTFTDGSTLANCTLAGTVDERQIMSITATCTTTAGLQHQYTVTPLDFVPVYERDSSLATIAGLYDDGVGLVTDIALDGTIFAQDPFTGCVTIGQVSIIDPDFNLYDFQFVLSNCTGFLQILNGISFTGLGLLDDSFPPDFLIAMATGGTADTLFSWFIFGDRL